MMWHFSANDIPYERDISLIEANAKLSDCLRTMRLMSSVRSTGGPLFAAECTLTDVSGCTVAYGYGKGTTALASEIGAMFEAAEHHLTKTTVSDRSSLPELSPIELAKAKGTIDTLPLEIITNQKTGRIRCRVYEDFIGKCQAHYPAALIDPSWFDQSEDQFLLKQDKFDYGGADRYSNNSGVAIGCSKNEALVHGLMEAIERESLSKLLIDAFLLKNTSALRVVDRRTLPPQTFEILNAAEHQTGLKIEILSLISPGNIPVYCAVPATSHHEIEPIGLGASLIKSHALQRALTELVQSFYIASEFRPKALSERDNAVQGQFASKPLHLRCAQMKIFEFCNIKTMQNIEFGEDEIDLPKRLTSEIISSATKVLADDARLNAYCTPISIENGGVEVWHTMLNEHDNFFCVTEGGYVLPDLRPGKFGARSLA